MWPMPHTHRYTHRHKCRLVLHNCLSRAPIDTDVLVIKSVGFDVSARLLPKTTTSALSHRNVPLSTGRENCSVAFGDYSPICALIMHVAARGVCVSASCAWLILDLNAFCHFKSLFPFQLYSNFILLLICHNFLLVSLEIRNYDYQLSSLALA